MKSTEENAIVEPLGIDPRSPEPILDQALKTALDDEYRAYETYTSIIETFGAKPPFASIVEAEKRHQNALLELFAAHQITPIENRWQGAIAVPQTLHEAYALGVEAEIANIAMYDTLLAYTQNYPDVQDVFYRLQAASYNHHLAAFSSHLNGQNESQTTTMENANVKETVLPSMEKMSEQMNEWSALAAKAANGQMSHEEMLKLLSGTNLSFIAGALIGAIGAGVLGAMTHKNEDEIIKE